MYKIPFKKFIPGIVWFFVVLFLICLPGKDLPQVSWLDGIPDFDKVVHIGIFGVLCMSLCWPFYKSHFTGKQRMQYFIRIAISVSIWGLTTEFIQKFFIPGRNFDLLDWAADSVGALLSFFICLYLFIKWDRATADLTKNDTF